jgi:hypothetical protein
MHAVVTSLNAAVQHVLQRGVLSGSIRKLPITNLVLYIFNVLNFEEK